MESVQREHSAEALRRGVGASRPPRKCLKMMVITWKCTPYLAPGLMESAEILTVKLFSGACYLGCCVKSQDKVKDKKRQKLILMKPVTEYELGHPLWKGR
ncbi:MAG: hypothetical protein GY820_22475 [Gammaproteobacteria bacterium]|nr:hypothetical protein [Gammaproteobacteria bacterium]